MRAEMNEPVEINLGEGGEGSIDPCDAEFPPAECDDVGLRSVTGGKLPFREQGSSGRLVYIGSDPGCTTHTDVDPETILLAENAVEWAGQAANPAVALVEGSQGCSKVGGIGGILDRAGFTNTTAILIGDLDIANFSTACGGGPCDVLYVGPMDGLGGYGTLLLDAKINVQSFVDGGGGLVTEHNLDDANAYKWLPFEDLIGHTGATNIAGNLVTIVEGTHPVMSVPNLLTDAGLSYSGTFSVHSRFATPGAAGFLALTLGDPTPLVPHIIVRDSQPLADLIVFDLTHDPAIPDSATTIDFTAVVKNIGIAAAGPSLLCFEIAGDCTVGDAETLWAVPGLGINETFEVQRSQRFAEILVDTMFTNTAVADFELEVAESDENNNTTIDNYIVTADAEPVIVATITTLPASGTLLDSNGVAIVQGQTLTNTMVTYVPATGTTGTTFFEYTLTDQSTGLTSAVAFVDLTITAIIDPCLLEGRLPGCTPGS